MLSPCWVSFSATRKARLSVSIRKGCVTMSITVPDSLSGARIFHLSMAPEAGWYIRRGHQSAKENILMTEDCFFKTIDCLA
ncbi:TPA: hypothetical protein I4D48_18955 [Enterobacter hormaechei]|nr:hypothetical protein [Enterobacter hormaechei]